MNIVCLASMHGVCPHNIKSDLSVKLFKKLCLSCEHSEGRVEEDE